MMNIGALVQLKAFARLDALALTGLWTASFLITTLLPTSTMGSLLALSTPVLVEWLLMRFRNRVLDGFISFKRALAYTWYVFFYAILLFALVQYVYLKFFDNGAFMSLMLEGLKAAEIIYAQEGLPKSELAQAQQLITSLPPIQMVFIFMMQNIFISIILSPILALIGRKEQRAIN